MTHPNVELMSMLVEHERERLRNVEPPPNIPARPGRIRRTIGTTLISLGEHIGGPHTRPVTSTMRPSLASTRTA